MKNFKGLVPVDYLRIFWRRRWYFVITFGVVGGGIYIWSKYILSNLYRSDARIAIESAAVPPDYVRPSDASTPEAQIAGVRELLARRSFLLAAIQANQLFGYGQRGFREEVALASFGRNVTVSGTSRNTVTVSYTANDQLRAQKIAQWIADNLVLNTRSARRERARESKDFILEQLTTAQRELEKREQEVKEFKNQNRGRLPEQRADNINMLNGLNSQIAAVENVLQHARDQQRLLDFREQERQRLGFMARTLSIPTPNSPSEDTPRPKNLTAMSALLAAKQAELSALNAKYMPAHPDVRRVAREVEDIQRQLAQAGAEMKGQGNTAAELTPLEQGDKKPASGESTGQRLGTDAMLEIEGSEVRLEKETLNNEIAKRDKEKEQLLRQRDDLVANMRQTPEVEQQLIGLTRDLEILRQQYSSLRGKQIQAEMTQTLEKGNEDNYRIIDQANLPTTPVFPDRRQIQYMGLGLGFLLALGAALGRESLDTTLATEYETELALKLPVLASISEIPHKERRRLIGTGRAA